jgi:UDP-GlcNAc:undecaprenyl-phosphate GlcNAc-1-phosphate transferase
MRAIPAAIASFLVAVTMVMALRPLARVLGLMDKPGGRKTHRGEIPLVGGLAMLSGLLIATLGGSGLDRTSASILVVAAFIVLLGTLDDLFDLPPRVRLLAHLSAAVAMVYGSGLAVEDLGDLTGLGTVHLGLVSLPFTVISTIALINAFNMLDGLDGLAATSALIAFAGVMGVASLAGMTGTALISGGMIGAVAAFLLFNAPVKFNRSFRTFMGDAGSTLLGFLLAALSLTLVQTQAANLSPLVVLWMMPIPIYELFSSTGRRLLRGTSPTDADTDHFHHRLIAAGLSVRAICALYAVLSAASCAFAVWAYLHQVPDVLLCAGFCVSFLCWRILVRNAHRFAATLPQWCRHVDASAGH